MQICEKGFNAKKNCFVQAYGSDELDASLLLMPLVGFLPGTDPRVQSTVEAIRRELMPDGLVLRYNTSKVNDGLPPGEGVFLACSFLDGKQFEGGWARRGGEEVVRASADADQ